MTILHAPSPRPDRMRALMAPDSCDRFRAVTRSPAATVETNGNEIATMNQPSQTMDSTTGRFAVADAKTRRGYVPPEFPTILVRKNPPAGICPH